MSAADPQQAQSRDGRAAEPAAFGRGALPHHLTLAAAFVGARLWAHAIGLRFDASEWPRFWHFVDAPLLRDRLLESLLYLHSQPPAFNLTLGVTLKLFGDHMAVAWHAAFALCGAVLTLSLRALALRLGAAPWPATLAAALFCTAPATLLYEHFLFYTYPVAALLLVTALSLHRALERGGPGRFALLFGCAALLPLTRALFHPTWLLLPLALGLWGRPAQARTVLLAAALPCLLVALLVGKNLALFGHASTSSWRGMNLARVALDRLPDGTRERLLREGAISPLAAIGPFEPIDAYAPHLPPSAPAGVPLLDRPLKHNGAINLHHRDYPRVSDRLERDSVTAILAAPAIYLRSVGRNLARALEPATTYAPLRAARRRIAALERVHTGALHLPLGPTRRGGLLLIALPLVLGYGALLARRRDASRATRACALFIVLTVSYVLLVGALLERSENQRFRFTLDATLLALGAALLTELARRLPRRRARPRAA